MTVTIALPRCSTGAGRTALPSSSAWRPPARCAKRVATVEASTTRRFERAKTQTKVRRFKEFHDGAASWSRTERIIARVEVGSQGCDTRFIVTNLPGGRARTLYERVYCRRRHGREPHQVLEDPSRRPTAPRAARRTANQFRLFLHAGAYWLMWGLRAAMRNVRPCAWRSSTPCVCASLKIAARVVEMKTRICLHLPTSCPDHAILRIVLSPDTTSRHVATGDVGAPFEPRDRNLQTPPLTPSPPPKSGGAGHPCGRASRKKSKPPGDTRP